MVPELVRALVLELVPALVQPIQNKDPEQHTAEADIANRTIIHFLGHRQHRPPATRADKWQHAFHDEEQRNRNRKYLPEIHTLSRTTTCRHDSGTSALTYIFMRPAELASGARYFPPAESFR